MRIFKMLSSDEMLAGPSFFAVGYAAAELMGVFSPFHYDLFRVLHKLPLLIALMVLLVNVLLRLGAWVFAEKGLKEKAVPLFLYFGIILVISGIFVSRLTRFEGIVMLTEGQVFSGEEGEYREGSIYRERSSDLPRVGLEMLQVSPVFSRDGRSYRNVHADLDYLNPVDGSKKKIGVNSLFPMIRDGVFYRVTDFGYSPRYRFTSPSGTVIEGAFYLLKIFPPGSEDYFRTEGLPHTFYVRYYPDVSMIRERELPAAPGKTGPVFGLRISRNIDLVFNGYISPYEKADTGGNTAISFEDIRKWAEIKIVRDYGLFLIMPGVLMMLAAGFAAMYGKRTRRGLLK